MISFQFAHSRDSRSSLSGSRWGIWLLVFVLGCSTLLLSHQTLAQEPDRPNLVLIMADDLGWKDLHCYGNQRLDTPRLDQLASQGMRFTDGYAAAPVCTPTRAAIMTGLSPARLGITNHAPGNGAAFRLPGSNLQEADWNTYLALEYKTLAEHLKDAGYATGFFGKWHLSDRKGLDQNGRYEVQLRPEFQGFDRNVGGCRFGGPPSYFAPYKNPALNDGPEGEYLPERLADECIAFMKENRERPFFLCWWNYSVHYPFQAKDELIAKYEKRKGPGISNPTYAAMLEGMDQAIGRLLDELDHSGLSDNTVVVFTSDNGSWGTEIEPLRGQKGHLFEGGIRVPWIIRWPGQISAGSESSVPIISTDLFPTFLALAGIDFPAEQPMDGQNLLPLFTGEGQFQRDALFFHYPNYAFHKKNRLGSAIREGQYKLIYRYDDQSIELYDLQSDVGETRNLATEKPMIAERLHARLEKWLVESNAKRPVIIE